MNPMIRLVLAFACMAGLGTAAHAQKGTLEEQFTARVTALLETSGSPAIADKKIRAYRDSVVAQHPGKAAALDKIVAAMKTDEVLIMEEEPVFIDQTIEEEEPVFMDMIIEEEPVAVPPPPPPPPPPMREPGSNSSGVFAVVEKMPLFPGCEDAGPSHDEKFRCSQVKLKEYVLGKLEIPEETKKAGGIGRIVAQFVVEKDGSVSEIRVPRGMNEAMDAAVIRAIESMNSMPVKWTPGFHRGESVRVSFSLPIMIDARE